MKLFNIAFVVMLLCLMTSIAGMALTAEPKTGTRQTVTCQGLDGRYSPGPCVTMLDRRNAAVR